MNFKVVQLRTESSGGSRGGSTGPKEGPLFSNFNLGIQTEKHLQNPAQISAIPEWQKEDGKAEFTNGLSDTHTPILSGLGPLLWAKTPDFITIKPSGGHFMD